MIFLFSVLAFTAVVSGSGSVSVPCHDYYVSRCVVNWVTDDSRLEISLYTFIDDLELALEGIGGSSLFLCSEQEDRQAEFWLLKYLREAFVLRFGDTVLDWRFLGKENSDDLQAVWCFMEVDIPDNVNFPITLENQLLFEVYEDQKNIVEFKVDGVSMDVHLLRSGKESVSLQP